MRLRLAAALLALLAALPSAAAPRYRAKGRPIPYEGFFSTFPSGLRLVVYEMPQVDRFMLSISYRGGAVDDPEGKEGLAHLAEHLAFRARPQPGLPRYWDQLQGTGWSFNAWTAADDTVFYEIGKAEDLPWAVALEAARMADPLLGVTEDDLAVERDVVISEYRERFETLGSAAEIWPLFRAAFPAGHPYARSAAHDPASYRRIGLADVKAWVKERYQPAGAVMVVVSPMKARQTADLVLTAFGKLATGDGTTRRDPLPWKPPPPPDEPGNRELTRVTAPVHTPRLWVGWPIPGYGAGEAPLARATAEGLRLALRKVLADDVFEGVVDGVSTGVIELDGAGLMLARIELRHEKDAARILERVKSAAAERLVDRAPLLDSGMIHDKANRLAATDLVREQLLVEAYLDLEQLDTSAIARFVRATGNPDYLRAWAKMVSSQLSEDRLDGYAYAHLKRGRAVGVLVAPDGNGLPSGTGMGAPRRQGDGVDELEDEGGLPPPGPERALAAARAPGLDRAERRVLPNGLEVILAKRGTLPIAEVRLVVRTDLDGTAVVPAGLPHLALPGGTGQRADWDQFMVGAARWITIGPGQVVYRSRGTGANLDVLVEGAANWADTRRVEDFVFHQRAFKTRVAIDLGSPALRSWQALLARLFPGHPYGALPSPASIEATTEKAADRWLDRSIRPERSTLVVVGDLEPSPELWAFIEGQFGGWKPGKATAELPSRPAPLEKRTVTLLHRPGASQALLLVGWQAPPAAARDEAGLSAFRRVLADRIQRRVRLEDGVSYGVQVAPHDLHSGGAVVASLAVDRAAAGDAVRHVLDAAGALAASPVDLPTAARARWQVARRFGMGFDTVDEAADALQRASALGLGLRHYEQLPSSIAALDAARIQAAARALGVGREVVVVIGDKEALLPLLRKAGLEPELIEAPR